MTIPNKCYCETPSIIRAKEPSKKTSYDTDKQAYQNDMHLSMLQKYANICENMYLLNLLGIYKNTCIVMMLPN